MSVDLTVNNPLNQTPQVVDDQNGNASSLFLGAGPTGLVGVVGPGGPGATATLSLSTYAELDHLIPNVQITATDQGDFSAIVDFNLQKPGGSGTGPFTTPLVLRPTGGVQMPNLPPPTGGSVDLVIDSAGNLSPQNSSARFKEDIRPLQDDFHKVLLLEPRAFTYKDSGGQGIGYTAEEVAEANLHNLVAYNPDGQPQGVHYKMISIYLLELLKEQQAALADIRAEIAQMKDTFH
jgi:hypothetical protein